jgi:flagellar hook-associated protein 1 FlgK
VGSPAKPALWSRYDGVGGGVDVAAVSRLSDALLDARSRQEHARQSYLDLRQAVLERVETGIGEPGDNGLAAALADFRSALHDLANNPDQDASRSQLLARAGTLADAFRVQAANIDNELGDLAVKRGSVLAEANTVAADLARTNESIASARLTGVNANDLLDNRDRLAQRLAELTGATTTVAADGTASVTVGGVPLVSGKDTGRIEVVAGGFQVIGLGAPGTLGEAPTGELGATTELLSTTLPAYRSGLGQVARDFAVALNAQHAVGYDRAGQPGGVLFSFDPADPAGTLAVAVTDVAAVAASGLPGPNRDGGNAEAMAALGGADDAYQRLVNGFATGVVSAQRLAANQQALTSQVDGSREQLGGVSIDEETVNLIAAQRGYEAASRVITVLDSVLDTLINRTGLVR